MSCSSYFSWHETRIEYRKHCYLNQGHLFLSNQSRQQRHIFLQTINVILLLLCITDNSALCVVRRSICLSIIIIRFCFAMSYSNIGKSCSNTLHLWCIAVISKPLYKAFVSIPFDSIMPWLGKLKRLLKSTEAICSIYIDG